MIFPARDHYFFWFYHFILQLKRADLKCHVHTSSPFFSVLQWLAVKSGSDFFGDHRDADIRNSVSGHNHLQPGNNYRGTTGFVVSLDVLGITYIIYLGLQQLQHLPVFGVH
jgi:hypothetical protein